MPYTKDYIQKKLKEKLDASYVLPFWCFAYNEAIKSRKKMSSEKFYYSGNLYSIFTFALIVRWSVSLHSYSGENTPPMYGDYEAQRHWMELTVNLPLNEWYLNTSKNDLMYWGLDYPPLTAYHSYLNGKIAYYINPEFVELNKSRGYESYHHKFFMRATVIFSDLLIYFMSAVLYCNSLYENQSASQVKHGEVSEPFKPKAKGLHFTSASVSYLAQLVILLLYPDRIKLAKFCILSVLATSFISLYDLFRNPTIKKLLLSFINVSLSFFLFSYQVHEKSILLTALPILLYFPFDPFPCFWFLLVSTFSMFPLLLKDGLLIPFISLTVLFTLFVFANVNFHLMSEEKKFKQNLKGTLVKKKHNFIFTIFKLSIFLYMILFLCSLFVKPPEKYPDLWPLLLSIYSFLHFFSFKIYFNVIQIFFSFKE
ncbi:dolichyl glycosyltransferase, putative [Pediculus humanus corporis]|uniref:Alpha-1,3-glucosyltransferase n=1 Tax=Pediculus humanus subsp. corporis TaxID=121224 RepID=E0VUA0_PEDHC|nr:dolichyl glycosyltransferase, putative [Pediculus humanus corporis]EEB16956.1 dolichyl glycosyltransferase, putative [Pediculus humanus corporis]